MRHHTSTHILLGAARRVLGDHVWQAGAEKTPFKARLDITHHKPLTREEIKKIENLANMIVDDRRELKFMELPRNEAEEKYGFRIYQGGVPLTPTIRLVEIPEWDVEACGGTHLANTGEAGAIKIINSYRIQDGVVRLEYIAGTRVYEEAASLEDKLDKISELLKADRSIIENKVKNIIERLKELEYKYKKLLNDKIESMLLELSKEKVLIREAPESNRKELKEIMKKLTSKVNDGVIVFYYKVGDNHVQVELSAGDKARVDLGSLTRTLASKHHGKGGGRRTIASARIPEESLNNFIKDLIKNIKGGNN